MQSDLAAGHDCKTAAPAIREQAGCDAPIPEALRFKFAGIAIERCPAFYLRGSEPFLKTAFNWYSWRDKGFLPTHGGYEDQPNKYVEICDFIDMLMGEKTRKMMRK